MLGADNRKKWTDLKGDEQYTVYGWMLKELNLRLFDANVYAIIYHDCVEAEEGNKKFDHSVKFLGQLFNVTRQAVMRALVRLEESELIYKHELNSVGGCPNEYFINMNKVPKEAK